MVIAPLSAVVHQLLCLCGAGNYLEETPWPLEEVPLCRNHFNFCLKMKSMSAETCCIAVDPQGTPPHMVIATLSVVVHQLLCLCDAGNYLKRRLGPVEEVPLQKSLQLLSQDEEHVG